MVPRADYPFSEGSLSDVLRARLEEVLDEIKGLDTNYVLNASPTEVEQHFVEAAGVSPLVLHVDQRTIGERSGVKVDVSHDFDRGFMPGDNPYVRGTRLRFDIPYDGDRDLWRWRPSTFAYPLPEIEIADDYISFYTTFPDDSPKSDALKSQIESDTSALRQTVDRVTAEVSAFNAAVPAKIRAAIEERLRRARTTSSVVEGLGIPLKRTATPPAYAIPLSRRPSPRVLPRVETQAYQSEPFLRPEEYEYILGVLKSMGLVMERAPKAFATVDEETIRTVFLLHLNGHYEGGASGETFNAQGKTDILIREKDRNVFIAECKFWRGEKTFQDAIDQLLGYLSWRDSKCALLIFNKTKNSTAVAEKMHEVMQTRPECKKYVGPDARGDHRYIFVKPSDPGREITITTQLFDVPRAAASNEGELDR
jgi:hypothetical protein